jgi:hypothetical protein
MELSPSNGAANQHSLCPWTQVAERAPCKGSRLAAERTRKFEEAEGLHKRRRKIQKAGTIAEAEEAQGELEAHESVDEESKSELLLIYNSARGYVLAIIELWTYQVSEKLHSSLSLHNIAGKALRTPIARGQYQCRRAWFEDCGISTIEDGHTANQILI